MWLNHAKISVVWYNMLTTQSKHSFFMLARIHRKVRRKMKFEMLCNNKVYVEDVALEVFNEFVLKTASTKSYKECVDFFSHTYEKNFPMTFIATKNEKLVGSVSLFENDWAEKKEATPWIASLVVEHEYRNQKIAEKLLTMAIAHLEKIGYEAVFLKTENAPNYYIKRGYQLIEVTQNSDGQTVYIFSKKCHG